ncbi:MAG: thiamine diphosphokinase [Euryarchaeota archaeon]|nr:thiamine diphosphokinase [Euryarchaeota archaeon]
MRKNSEIEKGTRFGHHMDRDYCLILANGPWPTIEKVRELADGASEVIACDGALNRAFEHKLNVDITIGDMDSVDEKTLEQFSTNGGKVIENKDQHSNDLAKAFAHCEASEQKNPVIVGGLGGDGGHEWANILTSISSGIAAEFIGKKKQIRILSKGVNYSIEIGMGNNFSLFAIPYCEGVELSGARFELTGERLEMGSQGLHNVATSKNIKCSFQNGSLFLVSSLSDEDP